MIVVVQRWEESERGWGVRPDGYSIHPDIAARNQYVKEYWATMPNEIPDEYSRPCVHIQDPVYLAEIELVNFNGKCGIRYYENECPPVMKYPTLMDWTQSEDRRQPTD